MRITLIIPVLNGQPLDRVASFFNYLPRARTWKPVVEKTNRELRIER